MGIYIHPTPLFDTSQPVQVTTLAGLTARTVAGCTAPWGEVFGVVHQARSKVDAPCIIPGTFRPSVDWTRGRASNPGSGFDAVMPRPQVRCMDSVTAILIDLDRGDVTGGTIEEALTSLGLAGTYWSTWSSTVVGPRWRITIPLANPYVPRDHRQVWSRVAVAVRGQLRLSTLDDTIDVDWSGRSASQPSILPCRPVAGTESAAASAAKYPWGCVVPNPVHVDGHPVVPSDATAADGAAHYANALRYVARSGRGGDRRSAAARARQGVAGRSPAWTPSADGPGAASTVAAWRTDERYASSLPDGLDACERVRRDGLGAAKGGRGAVLRAGCFHLHRCGWTHREIQDWAMDVVERTPGQPGNLVDDLMAQVRYFERRQSDPATVAWTRAALGAISSTQDRGRGAMPAHHTGTADRFVRILAHADHIRCPAGAPAGASGAGQLSFAQLALVLGMPAVAGHSHPAIIAWRQVLIEAGLLHRDGVRRDTRYSRIEVSVA